MPNPPPALAEKLKPDAEPKPEGAAAEVLSEAAKEKEEAEGAGEAPNPEGGGAVGALPKPVGGVDTEANPEAGAAKLKLFSWSDAPKLLLPNPNVGPASVEPKPVEDPCGALLFSSLSKAARVAAFIILSS